MLINGKWQSNRPIEPGDKLEVIVKHRFEYTRDTHRKIRRYTEMLFVDIVRNLTRPHVNVNFQ